MQDSEAFGKKFLYFMFVIQILAWELAIALVILLGAQGYVGFDGASAVSVTSCNNNYFTSKYTAIIPITEASLVGSIVTMVSLTIVFVIMLVWVVRVCKDGNPTTSIKRQTKLALYLLTNFAILGEIPAFGYYLIHLVQLNNCTATYNLTQIIIIFIIAALLLLFAFLYLILSLWVVCKDRLEPDSKYRDIISQPTQPHQDVSADQTYQQFQRKSPYVNHTPKGGRQQYTKQNLLQPQQGSVNKAITRSPSNNQRNATSSHKHTIQENNYPSRLTPYQDSYYGSSALKAQEDKRSRSRKIKQDEDDFQAEQNRFMKKYQGGGSILPLRGVEQKSPYKKTASDNFIEADNPKRHRESPPSKLDRQGVLISHIRGKYGN